MPLGIPWSAIKGAISNILGTGGVVNVNATELRFQQGNANPLIDQVQQTAAASPSSLTLAPQAPNAGALTALTGTPGSLVINLAAPVSTGVEAYFHVSRAGSTQIYLGQYPGIANIGALWLLANGGTPTTANWVFAADVPNNKSYVSSSGVIYMAISGTPKHTFNADGLQLGGSAVAFGSGTGAMLGINNATAVPSTNPASGGVAYATGGALVWRGSSGAKTVLAPAGGASVNTQAQLQDCAMGTVRTVSSATVTAVSSYATTSGTSGRLTATVISRAVTAPTSGAIGDTYMKTVSVAYRNVAGVLTLIGSTNTIDTNTDTSMSGTAVTVTVSGTTINVNVANVASATVDTEAEVNVTVN